MKFIVALTLVASASAFAPATVGVRVNTAVNSAPGGYGKYDDTMWNSDSKNDVYALWNPAVPRSALNFNPYETFGGNSPDASGFFPGEGFYKDPVRGDINFAQMMVEREQAEARAAAPKPGDAPGCPGCRN
mmetsp:Transcript_19710/g.32692  ORF Transcript_19710/g.32692 Transcript_19710/m.32692 type:complete len:131 (-) Transcript_19710:130-522(-)|eukprot:CAMPEP_0119002710 /NCGR_PEP_ID=MMETSP1176-20130426/53_1 /TAXON_ID=265551 /ORGANISM="Synedropsis recta cf, Strain CCMP1620" /LENGTH=130 /DNA_ID=CAMNT_0006954219 /DNA_START=24 /DNA_END=416 /DNA_ORIENTATION=-